LAVSGARRNNYGELFGARQGKQVPRIAELCVEPADAALRQKDRKATSFYPGREYHHARLRPLVTNPHESMAKVMEKDFDVDLVYLWVDGSDPQWLEKKNAETVKIAGLEPYAAGKGRFADNDELKYSLRSVEKYAPWINRIFIITDEQIPKWLNTKHPKIKIIDHIEIMPAKALPCFNSMALETGIPNIKDLSEHFLYANDDMFFADHTEKAFFFDEQGMPIVRFKTRAPGKRDRATQYLIFQKYGLKAKTFHHNIDAYLKTDYLNCLKAFEKEFEHTVMSKFRNDSNISRILVSYYMLDLKHARSKIVNPLFAGIIKSPIDSVHIRIKTPSDIKKFKYKPKLFCLNDCHKATDAQRQKAKEFLKTMFAEKSGFEV